MPLRVGAGRRRACGARRARALGGRYLSAARQHRHPARASARSAGGAAARRDARRPVSSRHAQPASGALAARQRYRQRDQPDRRHRRLGPADRSRDEDLLMRHPDIIRRSLGGAARLRRVLLAGSALWLAHAALAGGACAMTLPEALAATYNNNPTLLAQRARLRESDEGVPQALSGWRPTVQFTGSAGVQRNEATNVQQQTLTPRSLDLNITQPLYSGGRTVAATSQAENTVRATRALTLATEQQVMLSAVTSYLDVVQNQSVLELSINNEQVLRRQLEATQDRFRVGEVTRTDVSQAEATLATATATRVQAEGTLE